MCQKCAQGFLTSCSSYEMLTNIGCNNYAKSIIHISMWSNFSFSFFISQGNFVGWSANYKFYVGKWMRSKGSKSTRHHVPIDCADARFASVEITVK